jgi:hypothetical protein
MRKKLVIAAVISLVGVAIASVFYFTIYRPLQFFTTDMELAEQALVSDKMLVVGSLNVHQLLQLENLWIGNPLKDETAKFPVPKDSTLAKFLEAGIDPRADVDSIVASMDIGNGAAQSAFVVVGRFQTDKILSALKKRYEISAANWNGHQLYSYQEMDSASCSLRAPIGFYLSPNFVVMTSPDNIRPILERLFAAHKEPTNIDAWKAYRRHKLFAAMVSIPKDPPKSAGVIGMLGSQMKSEKMAAFDKLFFGAEINLVKRSGALDLEVDYSDPPNAHAQVAEWMTALQNSKHKWQAELPSFARLHDKITLTNNHNEFRAQALIDKQVLEDLKQVPDEVLSLVFSGFGGASAMGSSNEADQLADTAVRFDPRLNIASLPNFDPKGTFFEKPLPFVAGPLGFKIKSAKLDGGNDSQLIDLEFLATGVPNIGESKELVQLYFREALDANSQNQLLSKTCGPDRVTEPVYPDWFRTHNNIPSVEGHKTLKLNPGISASQIVSIRGEAKIQVPTVVETYIVDAQSGQRIQDKDTSLVVTKSSERAVSYNIYGDANRILLVQGLNSDNNPLRQGGSSSSGFLFGEGVSKSVTFLGRVKKIQVTVMSESRSFAVPFEIKSGLPQIDAFSNASIERANDKPMFENFSYQDFTRRFGDLAGGNRWRPLQPGVDDYLKSRLDKPVPKENQKILPTGPFTLLVEPQKHEPYFSLDVFANEIPNTAYTEAIQIKFHAIATKDGQSYSAPTSPSQSGTNEWVINHAMNAGAYRISATDKFDRFISPPRHLHLYQRLPMKLDADLIQKIKGSLRLRLLPKIDHLTMTDLSLGAVTNKDAATILKMIEVTESQYRFHYDGSLGELIGAQTFNADGVELQRSQLSSSSDEVAVLRKEGLSRIEFYFAREPTFTEYPFEIRL